MSGIGDDLNDPQSPLVHAIEVALMLDPQWHDPHICEGCDKTGICRWNFKLVATWVDCGAVIDAVVQCTEDALKNRSCEDIMEQKLRALTGTYRHRGITKHLCKAVNKVNSVFTPVFMGSSESFLKYLIDKNNPPINKPLVSEPWMPPLPAVGVWNQRRSLQHRGCWLMCRQ